MKSLAKVVENIRERVHINIDTNLSYRLGFDNRLYSKSFVSLMRMKD